MSLVQCQEIKYDKKIVKDYQSIEILNTPFMINELIEIYKIDSLVIKRVFNKKTFDRTQYTLYCYNVLADFFAKELLVKKNNENSAIIDRILSDIDYQKTINKPQIDWSNVFRTCQTCPFGEYPDERFFYFKFSIMFMSETEIKSMINYKNGEQWKYALEDIKYGDSFTLRKEENYNNYILDRRIANYIIEKWKYCDIPEIHELIATYKSVMKIF